jgi:hypothetical protein
MDEPVQAFLRSGSFEFERLWSLPASAEFFCGDGRIAAGHFALLQRLYGEERLDQVVVFDRLDPEPVEDWEAQVLVREPEMAARLLAEWDRGYRFLSSPARSTPNLRRRRESRWRRIWRASCRDFSPRCSTTRAAVLGRAASCTTCPDRCRTRPSTFD